MQLVITMVEHHVHLVGEMIDRAQALDDDQLDAPIQLSVEGIDDDPTVRRLLSRLVGQLAMWNCSFDSETYDWSVEKHEPLDSMQSRLAHAAPRFLDRMRGVGEQDRFAETFVDGSCEPPNEFTYGGVVAHVLTYAAHRRTLVTGALASRGVDVEDDPLRSAWFAAPEAAPSGRCDGAS